MKQSRRFDILIWVLALVPLAAAALIYPRLPQTIPTHWGFDGTADGYGPRESIFFTAALPVALQLLMAALPHLDAAGVLVLGVIAVVGTFAAFALYLHGVSIVGSVQGSLLGAIEPVSATAFSALWLGTAFSGADWVGFVLMMAMIFLVTAEKPEAAAQRGANEAEGERV